MSQWHVDERLLDRYTSNAVEADLASSVEAHVVACATCRDAVAARFDPRRLERGLDALLDAADRPRQTLGERCLVRLGVRGDIARLLSVTPSLRAPWFLGVVTVLALAAASSQTSPYGTTLFLLLAPVLPVIGVALAFGRIADPAHELVTAAPFGAFRLLLLRSIAVITTTVILTSVAAVFSDAPVAAMAWLLPALAMTAASVAVGTYVDPVRAAGGLITGWIGLVTISVRIARDQGQSLTEAVADLGAFHDIGQLTCLAVALAGVAITMSRRTALERRGLT